jgi:Flp pilus assembly protein TadD
MQNTIVKLIRASAIVGFIIASPCASAQAMELPVTGAGLSTVRELLRKGETFAAIRELRKEEAKRPRDGETVLLLGYAYYLAGQKKLFAQKAAAAAALLPYSPEPNYALGRYYLDDVDRRDLAAEEFRRALARASNHPPSLYHLGWCMEQEKQLKEAAGLYRQAIPASYWLAHLGLARLALDSGEYESALEHANTAVRLQPNAVQAHSLLAKIWQRKGDCAQAIAPFRRAAALDPSDAAIFYQLARCARSAGDTTLERQSLQQYELVRSIYSQK